MNPPPPMFPAAGHVTARAKAVATAVSTALPPWLSTARPTSLAGGETDTQIKYYNEDNPYQQDMKSSDAVNKYRGANVDLAA